MGGADRGGACHSRLLYDALEANEVADEKGNINLKSRLEHPVRWVPAMVWGDRVAKADGSFRRASDENCCSSGALGGNPAGRGWAGYRRSSHSQGRVGRISGWDDDLVGRTTVISKLAW